MRALSGGERIYRNYQEFLVDSLIDLVADGKETSTRNGLADTLYARTYTILNPLERFTLLDSRKNNPIATLVETMWVLSGRNDISVIEPYLKRAKNYSDDGMTWRAGYGPRLRRWHGKVDQVANVINAIRENRNTRRAAISLWDPEYDWQDSKDIPCNDLIAFRCGDNRLSMSVFQRSNDIMWGSMINVFEWSVLQELIASAVGMSVGTVTYHVSDFHLYRHHRDQAASIIAEGLVSKDIYATDAMFEPLWSIHTGLRDFDADLFRFMAIESKCHSPEYELFDDHEFDDMRNTMITDAAIAVSAYHKVKQNPSGFYLDPYVNSIQAKDMRVAVDAYLSRLQKSLTASKPKEAKNPHVVVASLMELQQSKGAIYGDSWKKHGEVLSIFSNISRKVDRINAISESGFRDSELNAETLEDTLADLAVYCGLYASWIEGTDFRAEMKLMVGPALDRLINRTPVDQIKDDLLVSINTMYGAIEAHLVGGGMMESDTKHTYTRMMAIAAIAWLCLGE